MTAPGPNTLASRARLSAEASLQSEPAYGQRSVKRSSWRCALLLTLSALACQNERPTASTRSAVKSPCPRCGVSLGLFSQDPLWDYQPLIDEIAAVGAGALLIVVPLIQAEITSSTCRRQIPDAALLKTLRAARRRGLALSLMPMIQLQRRRSHEWRGLLSPEEPARWWRDYRVELQRLATIATQGEVERLFIGSELNSLEGDRGAWTTLIQGLRRRFRGRLSYSANWDHYTTPAFWDQLDELSISAYFPVDDHPRRRWREALGQLSRFAKRLGKPLLISEYGYPPLRSASARPWDETSDASLDLRLQAKLTEVALAEIMGAPRDQLAAAFLWNWFGFGGTADRSYSPRGRPVHAVIESAFQRP